MKATFFKFDEGSKFCFTVSVLSVKRFAHPPVCTQTCKQQLLLLVIFFPSGQNSVCWLIRTKDHGERKCPQPRIRCEKQRAGTAQPQAVHKAFRKKNPGHFVPLAFFRIFWLQRFIQPNTGTGRCDGDVSVTEYRSTVENQHVQSLE